MLAAVGGDGSGPGLLGVAPNPLILLCLERALDSLDPAQRASALTSHACNDRCATHLACCADRIHLRRIRSVAAARALSVMTVPHRLCEPRRRSDI